MARRTDSASTATSQDYDRFDATVDSIGFVMRRNSTSDWAITDVVTRRYYVLAYAVSGCATYCCPEETFPVSAGELLFFPKGLMHSATTDTGSPWAFFSTTFELRVGRPEVRKVLRELPFHKAMPNTSELYGLFCELERLWIGREAGFMLRCRSILLQVLHMYVRNCCGEVSPVPHARKLASIVAMLQTNHERIFSYEELAKMVELSPSRFKSLFRAYTGRSVVQYQNWLRINRAKDLLLSGEYSVTEAAKNVGFPDVFYFSRLFRKLTGYNPSYFRNQ
ncbi:MAG: AraC family transcriptional regulator [Planctomycetaceae bacterium]|nr:AraC family transcriptional regulator [Planctomycetaceae bacterium]